MSLFKGEQKYEVDTFCLNCKKLAKTQIERGTEVKETLKTLKCVYCGIPTLKQWSATAVKTEGMKEHINVEELIENDS